MHELAHAIPFHHEPLRASSPVHGEKLQRRARCKTTQRAVYEVYLSYRGKAKEVKQQVQQKK